MSTSNTKRQISYYVIAIFLPFAFLLMLEGILRLSSYGNTYPLFVPSEQIPGYSQANPDLIKRYFPANIDAPSVSPDTILFKKDKPANTFRIVSMGGSTMAGFPYGRFGSPSGMLKQRLKAEIPDKNIEVISVALSSVNSYTLLDITDEIIAIQPDAVLIYAGHNEYLGVMGVGSVYASKGGHAANLMFLKVKNWRLFQLIQNIYYAIFQNSDTQTSTSNNNRTVMAKVAKNKNIKYKDPIFEAGIHQFKNNLNLILGKFKRAQVPTFIGNLVSNEQHQAPFASAANTAIENAIRLQRSDDKTIQQAKSLMHANYFYWLGNQTLKEQKTQAAHEYFKLATDFDVLRFRAPSVFNQIIRELAKQNNATLVDVYKDLHLASKHSIIGNDLMLEHLHPNNRGYFLIAESFYKALKKRDLIQAQYTFSLPQAWQLNPVNDVDKGYADYKIAQLKSDYPFTSDPYTILLPKIKSALDKLIVERIEGKSWIEVQQALLAYYQQINQFERAANVAGVLFDALPNQANLARIASMLYLRADILPMAKYYARHAVSLEPINVNFRLSLAEITFKLGDTQAAIAELNRVINIDPNNKTARQIKAQISQ